jgi:hypothetical protein
MTNVHYCADFDDETRRRLLYGGDLILLPPSPASLAFVDFARAVVEEAFAPFDPQTAQHFMPVAEYAALLAELKPRFIHHPIARACVANILRENGCDPQQTHFDLPRLRTATSDDYLSTGIAYAFHPHRDTWYSAPQMQINWWMPIYPVAPDNVMAFHPRYFDSRVRNSSATYNYYEWNRVSRATAAKHVGTDTREQPRPLDGIELDPQLRIVPPPGGILLFSGAQLHSTVPNTSGRTRLSIDFRTVAVPDLVTGTGAPNADSACTGTTLRDFISVADGSRLPEELVARYDSGLPADPAHLVFGQG